jgi:hypothetical protein
MGAGHLQFFLLIAAAPIADRLIGFPVSRVLLAIYTAAGGLFLWRFLRMRRFGSAAFLWSASIVLLTWHEPVGPWPSTNELGAYSTMGVAILLIWLEWRLNRTRWEAWRRYAQEQCARRPPTLADLLLLRGIREFRRHELHG